MSFKVIQVVVFLIVFQQIQGSAEKFDIFIIIDETSGSSEGDFYTLKEFLTKSMGFFSIASSNSRIFLTKMSNLKSRIPNTFLNRECFEKYVHSIRLTRRENKFIKIFHHLTRTSKWRRHDARQLFFVLSSNVRTLVKAMNSIHNKNLSEFCKNGNILFIQALYEHRRKHKEIVQLTDCISYAEYSGQGVEGIKKILKYIDINPVSYSTCSKDGRVFDECQRECLCKNKRISNCKRIRKEFTAMSRKEREKYIALYKYAASSPRYSSKFRDLLMIHTVLFKRGIHGRNLFLSWHRWYLWKIENFFREIDCTITLPYWNWSKDQGRPWRVASIWAPGDGIGGDGDPKRNYCVETGPFRERKWKSVTFATEVRKHQMNHNSMPRMKHGVGDSDLFCLRRSFKNLLKMPSSISVRRTLALGKRNFSEFELIVRAYYHDFVHCIIGGTMCTDFSADAPEFFLHHGFLDNIWADWQEKGSAYRFNYFQNATFTMPGSNFVPTNFLDNTNLPGCVSIKYQQSESNRYEDMEPDDIFNFKREESSRSKKEILSIASNLFGTSRNEQDRARILIDLVEPVY